MTCFCRNEKENTHRDKRKTREQRRRAKMPPPCSSGCAEYIHTLGNSDSDSTENRRVVGPSGATLTSLSNLLRTQPIRSSADLNCRALRSGDDGGERRRLFDGAAGLARLPRADAPAFRRRVRQVH